LLSIFQTQFFLTDRALKWLLKLLSVLLGFLSVYSTKVAELTARLPQSIYQFNHSASDLIQGSTFERRAVCRACDSLYTFKDCLKRVGSRITVVRCAYRPFKKTCNELLMGRLWPQVVIGNFTLTVCFVSQVWYPPCKHLYYILDSCSNVSQQKHFATTGLSDAYDGSIWKDFLIKDHSPFLSECNNYGLLLNIDWLQPYKHTEYSVGVIYLVILNLPHSIRFKRENVILMGVIPGPREPSLSVNSYLSPLVSDLLDLWKGVQLKQPGTDITAIFRCVLLGVACDLPAARKTCGFLSYFANLGCSRCFQNFSCGFAMRSYDNFDRDSW